MFNAFSINKLNSEIMSKMSFFLVMGRAPKKYVNTARPYFKKQ